MKKSKFIIFIIVIIVIMCIAITIGVIVKKQQKPKDHSDRNLATQKREITFDENTNENKVILHSTSDKIIEKDDIEVKDIEIKNIGGQLQVITIIKNNSKEDIKHIFIVIELLDKDGNVVTSIANDSDEKIEAGKTFKIDTNVVGLEHPEEIFDARIQYLQKQDAVEQIQQQLDDLSDQDISYKE